MAQRREGIRGGSAERKRESALLPVSCPTVIACMRSSGGSAALRGLQRRAGRRSPSTHAAASLCSLLTLLPSPSFSLSWSFARARPRVPDDGAARDRDRGTPGFEQARTEGSERERAKGERFPRAPVREPHSTQQRKARYECRVRIGMLAAMLSKNPSTEYFAFDAD